MCNVWIFSQSSCWWIVKCSLNFNSMSHIYMVWYLIFDIYNRIISSILLAYLKYPMIQQWDQVKLIASNTLRYSRVSPIKVGGLTLRNLHRLIAFINKPSGLSAIFINMWINKQLHFQSDSQVNYDDSPCRLFASK